MPKINPADAEAERIIGLQNEKAQRGRVCGIILLSLMFIFVSVFGILIWVLPQSSDSETENRTLETAPALNVESLVSGKFTSKITDFYADQFPCRNLFISLHAFCELSMLKLENNGIIVGRDGVLVERPSYTDADYARLTRNLNSIARFTKATDTPCVVAVAPLPAEAQSDSLPAVWSDDAVRSLNNVISGSEADTVFLYDAIKNAGGYLWYRTDHHWTTAGAYRVYGYLAKSLGYTAYTQNDFNTESVAVNSFEGTTFSGSGLPFCRADSVVLYRYDGDTGYTVSDGDTGDVLLEGFYDFGKLGIKDKYSVFLGGNQGHVLITDGTVKPRLLIIKDSYTNSLIPFLARHFELEVIDLRYYRGQDSIISLASNADSMLFLYGADSLVSDTDIPKRLIVS